ncbi:hypothetical protein IEQ34_006550 [Dendrobium chrysotoxum]|uniref:Uncharacterized protein n=1 Tax=Dendrobium chrysotoxum TaxID=161865 RepID=A0AAV7H6P4_DENCH|nr:hypothetical protein IEQ34_006550 [Dendrobium chrysotoxum]
MSIIWQLEYTVEDILTWFSLKSEAQVEGWGERVAGRSGGKVGCVEERNVMRVHVLEKMDWQGVPKLKDITTKLEKINLMRHGHFTCRWSQDLKFFFLVKGNLV